MDNASEIGPQSQGPVDVRVNHAPHEALFKRRPQDPAEMQLGDFLRVGRESRGITQTEMAARLNRNKAYLSMAEHGGIKKPDPHFISRYEQELGLDSGIFTRASVLREEDAINKIVNALDMPELGQGERSEMMRDLSHTTGMELSAIMSESRLSLEKMQLARRLILASARTALGILEEEHLREQSREFSRSESPDVVEEQGQSLEDKLTVE